MSEETIAFLSVVIPIGIVVIVFLVKGALEPDALEFPTFKQIKNNIFDTFKSQDTEEKQENFDTERIEYIGNLLNFAKKKDPKIKYMFETKSREVKYYDGLPISTQNDLHFIILVCKQLKNLSFADFKKEVRKRFYENNIPLPPEEIKIVKDENKN